MDWMKRCNSHYLAFFVFMVIESYLVSAIYTDIGRKDFSGIEQNIPLIIFGLLYFGIPRVRKKYLGLLLIGVLISEVSHLFIYVFSAMKLCFANYLHISIPVAEVRDLRGLNFTQLVIIEAVGGPVAFAIRAFISAPLWEELVRGVIYKVVTPFFGHFAGVVAALLPLVIMHYNNQFYDVFFSVCNGLSCLYGV
ncbi:type II CAAX prenyl endopeptidase Rce1 family protein [Frateuria aurantia]|uniref:Uncharacterized protein n=1 Tax=Frateuria aurantia (strain ATCC 33424 / DSM 6220 / KCTC 2777 / LMG 1558 / NBRC 3245 / NCIMB 13370) TaxID=767434 RepID=H8L6L5_FRAAD|nr:CPBP family glutamic-type intramembrane protease [Frateuria aurantia]AFC86831.1 hypothetical protein Fraau_2469 [Frateuria aurantia DSM 6220]